MIYALKALDEAHKLLERAMDNLHKLERSYKDLQDKYNELALEILKQKALAQPEQEPMCASCNHNCNQGRDCPARSEK